MRLFAGLSAVTCFACSAGGAARLDVEPDTLVLYGDKPAFVSINVIEGLERRKTGWASLTPRDVSIAKADAGTVVCRREGTTTIDVALDDLTTNFVVKCRFATRIEAESYFELEPDSEPRNLGARVVFSSGDSAIIHPVGASIRDSTVAVLRDRALVPLAVGNTGMRVDYGGLWVRTTIFVRRTVANETVTLGSGESRVWQLVPGRYTLTVKVKSPRDLNALNMETEALRCSRDSRDEDTIHCVAGEPAEITFRNTSTGSTARTGASLVKIMQIP